jgi:signal transduction histidine kinase
MGRKCSSSTRIGGFRGEAPTGKVLGLHTLVYSVHTANNNSFIDMTSHELRNPLSAVVQCAESVITTLQCFPNQSSPTVPTQVDWGNFQEDIHTSIEALQTIVSCSLHQKRVIDDVLTLSKLDSNLILITPIRVQPTVVVSDAMKMFLVECQQMDIQLEFVEDKSINELEWVLLDPSRLLQVLINLL